MERSAVQGGTPGLLQKFETTFDTYWNDTTFETYNPDTDRDRLDDAIAEASGRATSSRVTISLAGSEVRPYSYQQEMLDALTVERSLHGRPRNLVVAATGTGKTVLAALDYRSLCDQQTGVRPTLLFVAHRREILEQPMECHEGSIDVDLGNIEHAFPEAVWPAMHARIVESG